MVPGASPLIFEWGGRIVGRVANLPQNTLKIGKNAGFWSFHSRIWGSTDPIFKCAGIRTPPPSDPPPPVGDAPGWFPYRTHIYACVVYCILCNIRGPYHLNLKYVFRLLLVQQFAPFPMHVFVYILSVIGHPQLISTNLDIYVFHMFSYLKGAMLSVVQPCMFHVI